MPTLRSRMRRSVELLAIYNLVVPLPSIVELTAADRCVLVTQEVQGGLVGPKSAMPMLAEEARREALPNIGRLLVGARRAGVPVVHCLVQKPNAGVSAGNCRLFQAGKKFPVDLSPGSEGASLLPEFGPVEGDIVLTRATGLGPMSGTDLDPTLKILGARTIIGVGVSVNIAILNFAMDAVNRGYWFVLPRDAVAGLPREYADMVIDSTLSLLTHVVTTDEILAAWLD